MTAPGRIMSRTRIDGEGEHGLAFAGTATLQPAYGRRCARLARLSDTTAPSLSSPPWRISTVTGPPRALRRR